MHQDQFYITFGQQSWNTVQVNKNHTNTNVNTPVKAYAKKSQSDQHTISKTSRTMKESDNKQTHRKNDIYKENHQIYDDFYQHAKHKHPIRNTPKSQHKNIKEQNKMKQKMIKEALYPSHKGNVYVIDDSPHVSFRQNIFKTQYEGKNFFQNHREQYHSKQSRYFIDPLLDKYEIVKTSKKNYSTHQHQNKLTQYKQEMNKLDSLINKINQRISSSSAKFGI